MIFKIILSVVVLTMIASPGFASKIKTPNVSGQFYPSNPQQLSKDIDSYFSAADLEAPAQHVEMMIAPHAGYMYSGPVAAYSFKAVREKKYRTVVILAPSHFYHFEGAAVWAEGGFQTPLGVVDVDESFAGKLLALNQKFYVHPQAFAREHSLEVEIPFLQKTFRDFKIVPVILGQVSVDAAEQIAETLHTVIGERKDVLVVVSTDMSHYHDDATARTMDQATLQTVENLDAAGLWNHCYRGTQEMCGFIPVTTALFLAQKRNLQARVLEYATSGDVTGDPSRVVGYGSVIFLSQEAKGHKNAEKAAAGTLPLSREQKKELLRIAKQAIHDYIPRQKIPEFQITDPRLLEKEGAFVTLHKNGALRGCIGNIVSDKPLYQTVRDMAIAAAAKDPRFPSVVEDELPQLEVEVSVLSKPRPVAGVDEIEMGVHGVIVRQGMFHQGVFLPQVATETGWGREEFLNNLCAHKAGLPADAWKDPTTKIEIFTADVFSEKEFP